MHYDIKLRDYILIATSIYKIQFFCLFLLLKRFKLQVFFVKLIVLFKLSTLVYSNNIDTEKAMNVTTYNNAGRVYLSIA
ncbi:Uncharacterised protein [Candidatus Bartonella washoeensis]|uniref:Uncharacterized protein n=1 Tax=Candidatus Bartonella washoeensis Sb944nv TaxID=1094563 RepID=J0Z2A3_9HYPH|nr:hypothetical protein MCQ_00276 [Bartonella washoeensis Sb944nv]SPU26184.1 Uncharacterised protein [Bartonella washoeensis]